MGSTVTDPRTTDGGPAAHEPRVPSQGNGRRLRERLPLIQAQVGEIIERTVESGSHTNGAAVARFEREFAELVGVREVIGLSNGSAALRAACELLELPPGSEVLVPAYTFVMTAYSVSDAFAVEPDGGKLTKDGLAPVFVDVDPATFTLDPARAREAIGPRTRAMIVVHLTGQMADMQPLLDLARAHDLFVIEDAAQAHGARCWDPHAGTMRMAGSVGDLGCFSLSDVKNMGSIGGDAGALTIPAATLERFPDLRARAEAWRNTGRTSSHRYRHQAWGVRARMDEYAAAECVAELPLLGDWNRRRRMIAARFDAALAGSALTPPYADPQREHVYFNYLVEAPDAAARDTLVDHLRDRGIEVGDAYTVVADQEIYRDGRLPSRTTSLAVARGLAERLVPIPCHPELTEREVERIERALASWAA